MIITILGVPGSGKSYLAVYTIYKEFFKMKNVKYSTLFTNIADFDFHLFNSYCFKRSLNVNSFEYNHDKFLNVLKKLYSMHKDPAFSENDLVDLAKKLHVYKSLIVIDEAHNYFSENNELLTFFLTYHRHFYCDIYFVTQNVQLFYSKYIALSELFYSALRRSKALTNSFNYGVYGSLPLNKDNYIESFTLKPNSEVFGFYSSGGKVNAKSYGKKYLSLFLLGLFLFFVYIYYISDKITHKEQIESIKSNVNSISYLNNESVSENLTKFDNNCYHLKVFCDFSEKYCRNNFGNAPNLNYGLNYFFSKTLEYDFTYNYSQNINGPVFYYEYCVDPDFVYQYFPRWYLPPVNKAVDSSNNKDLNSTLDKIANM